MKLISILFVVVGSSMVNAFDFDDTNIRIGANGRSLVHKRIGSAARRGAVIDACKIVIAGACGDCGTATSPVGNPAMAKCTNECFNRVPADCQPGQIGSDNIQCFAEFKALCQSCVKKSEGGPQQSCVRECFETASSGMRNQLTAQCKVPNVQREPDDGGFADLGTGIGNEKTKKCQLKAVATCRSCATVSVKKDQQICFKTCLRNTMLAAADQLGPDCTLQQLPNAGVVESASKGRRLDITPTDEDSCGAIAQATCVPCLMSLNRTTGDIGTDHNCWLDAIGKGIRFAREEKVLECDVKALALTGDGHVTFTTSGATSFIQGMNPFVTLCVLIAFFVNGMN